MKLDISVAPEIALLAGGLGAAAHHPRAAAPSPAGPPGPASPARPPGPASPARPPGPASPARPPGPAPAAPATIGCLAACLRQLVAHPQSWWDLVRFDPVRPACVAVAAPGPGCEAWLLVLPPGYRGDGHQPGQGWEVACLVAGAITEQVSSRAGWQSRPLVPGRIRVRGSQEPRGMINVGSGFAVSLHAQGIRPAPTRAG